MSPKVEIGAEAESKSQKAWRAAFELLTIIIILLCLTLSARAQSEAADESGDDIASPARKILVSIPDRKLALIEGDEVVRIYDVAVGADESPTPEGEFQIVNRLTSPTYYHPGKVLAPGADNPLGTRWMGLSQKGFGIHGTNAPGSIGKAASHGCVRMRSEELEELFELVQVGDVVVIRGERDDEIASIFDDSDEEDPAEIAAATTTETAGAQQ